MLVVLATCLLVVAGLYAAIRLPIDAIPDATERKKAQVEWEYAQEVERGWPTLQALTAAMGMTEAQVDELFVLAGSL